MVEKVLLIILLLWKLLASSYIICKIIYTSLKMSNLFILRIYLLISYIYVCLYI